MRTFRILIWTFAFLLTIRGAAQIRRQVPAPDEQNGDFGSKFFDDLRSLFGRLQQSELDRAFQRAKAVHCSELVEQKGEWKQVAFLNDDRKLGDWHFDSIDEVKRDLVAFVFSGTCPGEESPVKVATSYPVEETLRRFEAGRIPFSDIVMSDNDPVSVLFDRPSDAYTFQLPYLYISSRTSSGAIYSLTPPLMTSKPEKDVAEEFRCKALSDAELTYRFLLCRTRVVDRVARSDRQNVRQPLGNAAYYILSDGKEASASVKLTFGGDADAVPAATGTAPAQPRTREPEPVTEATWEPAPFQARLVNIGENEFRLHFDPQAWAGRINKRQLLTGRMLSDFVAAAVPPRNKEYCVWRPGLPAQVNVLLEKARDDVRYSLGFRKDLQSTTSAVFEIQSDNGSIMGTLECYFPQNQTPSDITVDRWVSIVGGHIALDVRRQ